MNNEQVQKIVARVIGAVAKRLGATGKRGTLLAVFSGATVGLSEGFHQIRRLLLDGYRVKLYLSKAATNIYGPLAMNQLDGFPHWEMLDEKDWFASIDHSAAVVVPSLSINTLSKLSNLIADNPVTNITMHGLLMNKPVVMARNGADPVARQAAGMGVGHAPALSRALQERMQTIESYGAHLVDVGDLRNTINICLNKKEQIADPKPNRECATVSRSVETITGRMVTAVHVRQAHRKGVDLCLNSGMIVTPLAKDLASQYGVRFINA